jgi:hypothetical protein
MIPLPLAAEIQSATPVHPILGITDESGAITERVTTRLVKHEPEEGEAESKEVKTDITLYQLRWPESALITASL